MLQSESGNILSNDYEEIVTVLTIIKIHHHHHPHAVVVQ